MRHSIEVLMRKKFLLFLGFLCFLTNFIFAQNATPNYIPKGWRIPQSSDFKKGSGWNDFKSNGNPMPYFATGDFNGDNIEDYAWTLIKADNSTWGVFVFMNNGGGKYAQYYITGGKGKDNPVTRTVISRISKGENLCLYDDDENIKSKIRTRHESLSFGIYEVGENNIYYLDKGKNKFISYFGCME